MNVRCWKEPKMDPAETMTTLKKYHEKMYKYEEMFF